MTTTDLYAVVGNPIEHSKSPRIHTAFAAQTAQLMDYQKILCPLNQFAQCARAFFSAGGKGLNVTLPFKEDAYTFADQLTSRAKLAGAVNTLIAQPTGVILGDTTDGAGLLADLTRLEWQINNRRVLVLGAGGAVRGVLEPLLRAQPRELLIANRTLAKAEELASLFAAFGPIKALEYSAIKGPFDIVINGTSASLSGDLPPLPEGLFGSELSAAYDMMYTHQLTPFLAWAKCQGAQRLADGLGMLVEQAGEAFQLWRGITPNTLEVLQQLNLETSVERQKAV